MTPMIDVIFLLIVFFMLICQFISQDFERLSVPDNCDTVADEAVDANSDIVIQVCSSAGGDIVYTVGNRDFTDSSQGSDTAKLVSDISQYLREISRAKKMPVVRLRGDGRLACTQVRPAIKAVANAGLADIRFAAFKDAQK